MLLQTNESYESHRLTQVHDHGSRRPFLDAVRGYADHTAHKRRAHLIESVIRTSRGICDDDAVMPDDVCKILTDIITRYRLLASSFDGPPPKTYRDARAMLSSVFF